MTQARLEKLRSALHKAELDAVALNPGPTMRYLTGQQFHLMERPVVFLVSREADPAFILPELELAKMEALPYKAQVFPYGEDPSTWGVVFQHAMLTLKLINRRIGVEPRQLRLLEYQFIQSANIGGKFPDASETLAGLRVLKDAAEVALMKRAVQIAQEALSASLPMVQVGMTEKDLAAEIVVQLLRHGSDTELPFQPIVSSGPNSANPHASPEQRKLQAGDMLVIDWGAAYNGYISDLTRTFAVQQADPEFQKIHRVVLDANAAGRAAAKPGLTCADVDKAARDVIEQAGYGQYFTHRTGHGIGMEAHEDPYIRGDNRKILEPGMAFTVEPGIYLMGRNGVRIEDNVVITSSGVDVLSDLPREMQVLA